MPTEEEKPREIKWYASSGARNIMVALATAMIIGVGTEAWKFFDSLGAIVDNEDDIIRFLATHERILERVATLERRLGDDEEELEEHRLWIKRKMWEEEYEKRSSGSARDGMYRGPQE